MKITKEFIIEKIKEISKEKGLTTLPKKVFINESGISEYQYLKHFNTWNEAVTAAGLESKDFSKSYQKEDLFNNLKNVFEKCEGLCSRTKFNKISSISHDSYRRHFGSWEDALINFRKWMEDHKYVYDWIAELPTDESDKPIIEIKESNIEENDYKRQWNSSKKNKYGSFLNFRGLQHSPINEQGVVFLFGMVCFELGFIVEAIQSGFPDCEAKRRVNRKKDYWERVRIEFEYRSSNFQEHGHDSKKCDLIVCWEHDWKECPIEVIELKTILTELDE